MNDHHYDEDTEDTYTESDNKLIDLPILQWEGPANWQTKAACRGMDTTLFFGRNDPSPLLIKCQQCPVRLDCLEFAIRNNLSFGIYGGVLQGARRSVRLDDILKLREEAA